MKTDYNKTIYACFAAYIVQAIINNFVPLLFLTFQNSYGISMAKITMLVTFNFGVQLLVDLVAIGFVDRIGYRASIIIAHLLSAAGLISLAVLPELTGDPFAGLLLSVAVYAAGGGLLEVLVSPIVESCPNDRKEQAMSLLHSFYCWGYVGVILLSTVFFATVGIGRWKLLTLIWALVPACNTFAFLKVPMAPLIADGAKGMTLAELFKNKTFWILLLLMVCAGASEHSVAQWASMLAEKGLGVNKTAGDLAGPMLFAVMMGLSRLIYGKYGDKINLEGFMISSGILCFISYLLIGLTENPLLAFAGCALCGLSVGIMWPGTFSIAAGALRTGGTTMFALLALAGDLGCSGGPTIVGMISGALGDDLKRGILFAVAFPLILTAGICLCYRTSPRRAMAGKNPEPDSFTFPR